MFFINVLLKVVSISSTRSVNSMLLKHNITQNKPQNRPMKHQSVLGNDDLILKIFNKKKLFYFIKYCTTLFPIHPLVVLFDWLSQKTQKIMGQLIHIQTSPSDIVCIMCNTIQWNTNFRKIALLFTRLHSPCRDGLYQQVAVRPMTLIRQPRFQKEHLWQ